MLAEGAVKGLDENGKYTVDLDYSFISDSVSRKGIIELAKPGEGMVDDDFMVFVQVEPKSARSYSGRLELDCGSRIWYDVFFEGISTAKKVAYVTFDKTMEEMSAQPANDPIIEMLMEDENFEIDVLVVAADSSLDFSGYDAVVVQEGFSSGAAIFQPGNALALANLVLFVPMEVKI